MKKVLLALSILLILPSCTKKIMNSWIGETRQSLIMNWGPPVKTASDGGNGEILVYSSKVYIPGNQYAASQTYWDNRYFYVNSDGRVYHWSIRQERIPPQQIDLNIYKIDLDQKRWKH